MLRTLTIALLCGVALATPLKNARANSKGYCYAYLTGSKWCWLTSDGLSSYIKNHQGGYACKDYNGYKSSNYCKNGKKAGATKVHRSSSHTTAGGSSNSPWAQYLASMKGKSNLDWKAACKSLGQQPAGYGMSSGGGTTSYHLTCNNNKITVNCHGSPFRSCDSSYAPPATIADTACPISKFNVPASKGSCGGLSQKEVQEFLNIHNKMRCAVGAEPLQWDGSLQCQAQRTQNSIGRFKHSKSYKLPIHAGENLATGSNVATAAWMWFLEYLQSTNYEHGGETGHFTAMSWKGVTHVGCGIQRSGKGVIRCQYRGPSLPNFAGHYGANLKKFYGLPSDFKKCGMPVAEIKSQAKMQAGWGILHPTGRMRSNLGLFSVSDTIQWANSSSTSPAFIGACAFLAAWAMVTFAVMRHRRGSVNTQEEDAELLSVEAEGLE